MRVMLLKHVDKIHHILETRLSVLQPKYDLLTAYPYDHRKLWKIAIKLEVL